ncbi:rhomboid family intramembrane serine protease [Massilia litorea]|uniref:Rhomboid family intramembrane serine protease n=1 Tax=Massilia litorea TaxID=2769491 RepID=A0A7L9U9W5_9BURK|nr:rhomboid family intramembrane serine protease [Massilia litorea]QOL51630.1 rhomboid family intramembrane serine protease [Massilia litorea]
MPEDGPERGPGRERAAAGLALACLLLACLPESAIAALAWERDAILAGQWWRLWTGHLVHFGWQHALFDAVVLFAGSSLLERGLGMRRLLRQLLLVAPLISLALFAVPGLVEYRGASALAATVALAAGIALWPLAGRWRPALLAGGLACAASTAAQAIGAGWSAAGLPPTVAVAWQGHLLGAACALLPGWRAASAIRASNT